MARITISLVLIAAIAGMVANNASAAVPGQMLYPFKTNVNESLGRLFSVTDASKARFAADLAHQRLLELQTLTENGSLTPDTKKELMDSFDTEVKDMTDAVNFMQTEYAYGSALDIVTQFQKTLSDHIAILTALHSDTLPHLQQTLDATSQMMSVLSQQIVK